VPDDCAYDFEAMFSASDVTAFKAYIGRLSIAANTKGNYRTYVNWLNQYLEDDVSAIPILTEQRISDLANRLPDAKFNSRRKSDARSILRHFRNFKERSEIEAEQSRELCPSSEGEARRRILLSIAVRKGQLKFRESLLRRYSSTCVITGCVDSDVLEAAHITPYARMGFSVAHNGLLLRSDIHVLFDLKEISICPDSSTVFCRESIRGSKTYGDFHGRKTKMPIPGDTIPSLRLHYADAKG
jgi:predicted restriction endonuclease